MTIAGGLMSTTGPGYDAVAPLLDAARVGDTASWDRIVERFSGLLWATARAHRLDTADSADVVQTTWLRLVENLDRIQDAERLGGWLATTARRECLVVLKRRRREPPVDADETFDHLPDQRDGVDAGLLLAERDAILWQLFEQLSDRCRRLLRVLVADPPPAYADVAQALDMPIGSIGPTRQRCLTALRSLAIDSGAMADDDADLRDDGVTTAGGGR
jgi:RNA polymerase sigma factor (sigma-70 family)